MDSLLRSNCGRRQSQISDKTAFPVGILSFQEAGFPELETQQVHSRAARDLVHSDLAGNACWMT